MDYELRERFARLGPIRAIDRVSFGSPAEVLLSRRADYAGLNTVRAAFALAKRHTSMLAAKRAMEAVLERGEAVVAVPCIEDFAALTAELRSFGVLAEPHQAAQAAE